VTPNSTKNKQAGNNMNDTNAKQQIVERIKKSSTILVTVSNSPSVDELSAALGLTVLLNKMEKHATAVVSGDIPPAIAFLDPEKTFEGTVDSLRDFIIALDKTKADHLRYKVDGDVVKIFITPYRTTITSDDLDFSQGDYNVELVLALGVKNKDHLDAALAAHGRILHDATVATISAGVDKSELGSIDWTDAGASSLSEMLVGLADALKLDKAMLDEQVATAFMTGIVAATDRFSNNRTSSRVMTVAAQLMAAGANQQLIALKLADAGETSQETGDDTSSDNSSNEGSDNTDGTTDLTEGASAKLKKTKSSKVSPAEKEEPATPPPAADGSLTIHHETTDAIDEAARDTLLKQQAAARERAEAELAERTAARSQRPDDADQALAEQLATVVPPVVAVSPVTAADVSGEEPSMGGTLNATAEQAAEDSRRELLDSRNHTILSHAGEYIGDQAPTFQSPLNAANAPDDKADEASLFEESVAPAGGATLRAAPVEPLHKLPDSPTPAPEPVLPPVVEPIFAPAAEPTGASEPVAPAAPTLAEIDEQNRAVPREHEEARAAVEAAFGAVPYEPAPIPEPRTQSTDEPQAPELPPLPPLPPMPDFSTLPPLPPEAPSPSFGDATQPPLPPAPTDPGQFRIPGQ
jgi:hypothetical protein